MMRAVLHLSMVLQGHFESLPPRPGSKTRLFKESNRQLPSPGGERRRRTLKRSTTRMNGIYTQTIIIYDLMWDVHEENKR